MKDENKDETKRGKIIRNDEGQVREHLDVAVREAVEETLKKLLDAEADVLCGAARYERSAGRVDTRAGSYERGLHTKAGEVKLKVPRSCEACRLRRRSSSATSGVRAAWRRRSSKCIWRE